MKSILFFLGVALVACVLSCGKDHADLPTSFEYAPPPTPTDIVVEGGREECTIRWSYPPDARASIKEFRVYMYFKAEDITESIGTTTDTEFVDSLLIGNLSYCYRVSAVDTTGLEGWRSRVDSAACAFVRSSR